MYRQSSPGQLSFENFYLPFGGKLSGENRWVKLVAMIRWEAFESNYAAQFSEERGAPAKPFRRTMAVSGARTVAATSAPMHAIVSTSGWGRDSGNQL